MYLGATRARCQITARLFAQSGAWVCSLAEGHVFAAPKKALAISARHHAPKARSPVGVYTYGGVYNSKIARHEITLPRNLKSRFAPSVYLPAAH